VTQFTAIPSDSPPAILNEEEKTLVETFFKRSWAIHRLWQAPLAGHIDLLDDRLAAHGFSRVHSRIQLRLVGHFNRWLAQKRISADSMSTFLRNL